MPNYTITTSFAAGEIAPALYGNVSLAKYHAAATTLRNMWVSFRGGAYSRAGTAYVNRCLQPYGGAPPRLEKFQFNINQGYALEFGDNYMRVYANGQPIVEPTTTITGISRANPAVVQDVNSYANGDWIIINGVVGMPQVNGGTYIVAGRTGGAYTLLDLNGAPVDSTSFGVYASGGTAARIFTLATPWAAVDLPYLKFTQSADVMTLCCVNLETGAEYLPYDLARITASQWVLTPNTFAASIAAPATCTAVATTHPSTATSPPTLPAAYAYVVTAVSSTGEESVASPIANIVNSVDIAATAGSNIIDWSGVPGAIIYNVYKAPTSYNTDPGNTSLALPVPAGAIFSFIGQSYGTEFVDSNITVTDSEVPPVHNNPFARGAILAVNISSGGSGVTVVTPTITTGTGSGAILIPVVVNGVMTNVIVANGGQDYLQTDTISFGGPGAVATGTVTFTLNPSNLDTVTLNGVVWTFVTTSPGANQTEIRASLGATLAQLAVDLTASANAGLTVANYVANSTQLVVSYGSPGVGGNAYTLAASVGTPSGATLTGGGAGTNPTGTLAVGPQTGTYPGSVAYFSQRRAYAASLNFPDTFWMSKPGNYLNFDSSIPVTDADSITANPWSQQINGVQWMVPMPGGLVTLTGLGAWLVGGSGSSATNPQPITPTSIQAIQNAFNGSSAIVQPLPINFDLLYVQSKGSIVRDLSWNFWLSLYTGADLTQLSGQLFTGFQLLQSAWCEEPYKIAWYVRSDGALVALTYLKEQEVYGWSRHDTLGRFVSVASITEPPVDALYCIAQRPCPAAAGRNAYYVERMDNRIWSSVEDPWCVDCGLENAMARPNATLTANSSSGDVTFFATSAVFSRASVGGVIRMSGGIALVKGFTSTQLVTGTWNLAPNQLQPNDPNNSVEPQPAGSWTIASPIQVVQGLTHLAGLTVTGVADGIPISPRVVSASGSIMLDQAASNVKVGLGFLPQLQLPRMDPTGGVTVQGRRKTVVAVTARVEASVSISTGTNQPDGAAQSPPTLNPPWAGLEAVLNQGPSYTATFGGTVNQLFTGDLRVPVTPDWATPGQIAFQQNNPLPLQIIAVVPEYLEGDTPEVGYSQNEGGSGGGSGGGRGERQQPRPPGNWMLA